MYQESSSSSDSDYSGIPFTSKYLKQTPSAIHGHGATSQSAQSSNSAARMLSKNGPVRAVPASSSDDSSSKKSFIILLLSFNFLRLILKVNKLQERLGGPILLFYLIGCECNAIHFTNEI